MSCSRQSARSNAIEVSAQLSQHWFARTPFPRVYREYLVESEVEPLSAVNWHKIEQALSVTAERGGECVDQCPMVLGISQLEVSCDGTRVGHEVANVCGDAILPLLILRPNSPIDAAACSGGRRAHRPESSNRDSAYCTRARAQDHTRGQRHAQAFLDPPPVDIQPELIALLPDFELRDVNSLKVRVAGGKVVKVMYVARARARNSTLPLPLMPVCLARKVRCSRKHRSRASRQPRAVADAPDGKHGATRSNYLAQVFVPDSAPGAALEIGKWDEVVWERSASRDDSATAMLGQARRSECRAWRSWATSWARGPSPIDLGAVGGAVVGYSQRGGGYSQMGPGYLMTFPSPPFPPPSGY